jgi:hypothetical protein
MNSSQYKQLLKLRVEDQFKEFVRTMEDMFGEDYWKGFNSIGEGMHTFATNLLELYEASAVKEEPEDKSQEKFDEEVEDVIAVPSWEVYYKLVDDPKSGNHIDKVEGVTERHAKVMFDRKHGHEACEITSIRQKK